MHVHRVTREPTGSALFLILSSLTVWFAPFYARIRVYNEPSPKSSSRPDAAMGTVERLNFGKTEFHACHLRNRKHDEKMLMLKTVNKMYGFTRTNIIYI